MKTLNDIACKFNSIQIQLKKNEIQIDAKGIKNLLMIMVFYIYIYIIFKIT
jgi:hypothetical protein